MNRRTFINVLALAIVIALLALLGRALDYQPERNLALTPAEGDSGLADSATANVAEAPAGDSLIAVVPGAALGELVSEVRHAEIGFGSDVALREHFAKHGAELGAASPEAYLLMAQALRDRPAGGDVIEAVRPGGVITRFDRRGGTFVAFDRDLTLHTFFRPVDGEAYFRRQLARTP